MELVVPDLRYRDSFLEGLFAKVLAGEHSAAEFDEIARDVPAYLDRVAARATGDVPVGSVADSTYWMIAAATYVGRITLRHELNPNLEEIGGHVGYDVRAGFRRRGHATAALRQLLPIARARGLRRLLLTAAETNVASLRVIAACGGVFQDAIQVGDRPSLVERYWIDLTDP